MRSVEHGLGVLHSTDLVPGGFARGDHGEIPAQAPPRPQGVDDPSHLFMFADHLYLADVTTQPDERSQGRLPALHFAEDKALVGKAEAVRPRIHIGETR